MRNLLLILIILLTFVRCKQKSDYPEYTKSRKGFYYKLHTIGEETNKIQEGDFVTADISYYTLDDSLFFEGRRKVKLDKSAYRGAIEDCFKILRNDESATFILEAAPFFQTTLETNIPAFIKEGDLFKVRIDVVEIQTEEDFENEKIAFLNWIEDFGDYEKVILKQYIDQVELDVKSTESGLIYLPIKEGNDKRIQIGDTITINYEGRFLNGRFFDTTMYPFQFVYGTEWQVVKGLEEGLGLMKEGEKALFILPSELAFGKSGSSTGIIPPFTSLIFEVEVVSVKKGLPK